MNKSENINELAKALARVQEKMKPAEFDSVNPYFKSKYASLGSVIQAYKEAGKGEGITFLQPPVSQNWYAGVNNIIMHESGQWISQEFMIPLDPDAKNPTQEFGKAITYARRYGLASMLGIYSDEDIDGNSQRQQPAPEQKPEQRPVLVPAKLKTAIAGKASEFDTGTQKDMQRVAMHLSKLCGDDETRHKVQEYLFGNESLTKVSPPVWRATLAWLSPFQNENGEWDVSDVVKTEVKQVIEKVYNG
jgi:hypothetical protein